MSPDPAGRTMPSTNVQHASPPRTARPEPPAPSRRWLGPALVGFDLGAVLLSLLALPSPDLTAVVGHVVATEVAIRALQLRRARVATHWASETVGMLRVAAVAAVTSLVLTSRGVAGLPRALVVLLVTAMALWTARAVYRGIVVRRRQSGADMTSVAIIGAPDGVRPLVESLASNPEAGLRVHGVVGPRGDWHGDPRWLGTTDDVETVLARDGVRLVIVEPSALTGAESTRLVRRLVDAGLDVHVATGLHDLDHRRLSLRPLNRTPLLHVDDVEPGTATVLARRALDVLGATAALLITLPIAAVTALAIKLEDRGPIFYQQDRIGRDGRPFPMLKFRSMRENADREVGDLQAANVRSGPLFKLRNDPRVTRVGRMIRASSIDEIPQFVNVLRGEMSLVGPRPALASEVAEFDDELHVRHRVCPGLTGLWQVEGRDEADFEHYRTLDLYYVHNQSLLLDLTILLHTPVAVLRRAKSALVARRASTDTHAAVLD